MNPTWIFLLASLLLVHSASAEWNFYDPHVAPPATWANTESDSPIIELRDGSKMRTVLRSGTTYSPYNSTRNYDFVCGFYCTGDCVTYVFAILISVGRFEGDPEYQSHVVWVANRNNPVKPGALLNLTVEGNLELVDHNGGLSWSSNTSRKSVAGLSLTKSGNLILSDVKNSVVWQSFDHPTDTLVVQQRLVSGQKLVSSVSDTNLTEGLYSVLVTDDGLSASIESNPPQVYVKLLVSGFKKNTRVSYLHLQNGSLDFFLDDDNYGWISFPHPSSPLYLRLRPDGHLYLYGNLLGKVAADLSSKYLSACEYPMVCGKYGICSSEGHDCSCPKLTADRTNYFRQISVSKPNLGCYAVTPLDCSAPRYHDFIELENVTYFSFRYDIHDTDIDRCREACLRNCSCKAVVFRSYSDPRQGDCYLPSEIFSLMNHKKGQNGYNASTFIKVQTVVRKNRNRAILLESALGGLLPLVVIIGVTVFITRKKRNARKDEEDFLGHVPGMPTRFSQEELKTATKNFSNKLGEGGFGSVFEGVLKDGTRVAVKRLHGIGQVEKSFLAEVESIGSIHHVNLVRLIGFCAEKSQRLLVYEYMTNGSLDSWIHSRSQDIVLDWKCRWKIIQDVAKGLAYLHEECRQKIVHLDIKPQNILLDENYNAKLSDFGLSKLIDKDQSQVVTSMRGTPGYLAPEWLSAIITEKVDVYSFGVVVLEIISGRKSFELSEPEECRHLLNVFKMKAEGGRFVELIDKISRDMQTQATKVEEMMQLAAWCLQSDYSKRPSMSTVVMVLEGGLDVEKNLDYSSLSSQTSVQTACYADATSSLASLSSGPR